MEFALVAPLVALCVIALVSTALACIHVLTMHDVARAAARTGSVAAQPCDAATTVVDRMLSSATTSCSVDPTWGTITVEVRRGLSLPLVDVAPQWTSRIFPRASATFVLEPPPIIG